MNKNLKRIFGILLIGIFVLFFIKQVVIANQLVIGNRFIPVGPDGLACWCLSETLIPMSECNTTPYTEVRQRHGWFTRPSPTSFATPIWVCPTYIPYDCSGTEIYCCETNECGMCNRYCTRTVYQECFRCSELTPTPIPYDPGEYIDECYRCDSFSDPYISPTPWPTIPPPTPCQLCLSKTPTPTMPINTPTQPPVIPSPTIVPTIISSCYCQELIPVINNTNHSLSFKCLVVGTPGAQITNYTITIEKPNNSLINLNSESIESVSCPASVSSSNSCYQVTTTTINTTNNKGIYTMVVPPQIVCQ